MTDTPTSPPGFRDGIEAAAKEADSWEFSIWDANNEQTHTSREVEQMVADHRRSVVEAIRAIPTPDTLPTGWNSDMGEAPRDGTWVLVYASPREGLPGFVCPAAYHQDAGWCVDELRDATHWMPLPPPPPGE